MSIEGLTTTLEERGLIWQGSGFALIGAGSLLVLWVYSEADHPSVGIFRIAVTQLNWTFVLPIALAIEGIRSMFKTTTEIRKAARTRAVAKAFEKGEQQAAKRYMANLRKQGIELTPETELRVFGDDGHHKWWHHLPPFRSR